ncbi:hypothetical protein Y032_0001g218 [Ancylostoma ceylanicum]|uniref:Peptidase family M13 n=1 Tax=Ancylostoma ceylanicum TaxID=53326 RepID=A0A016W3C3_9BILA|nr:hypothetical protein Y032_0001g218 [Ancylostoma ceylanicum]
MRVRVPVTASLLLVIASLVFNVLIFVRIKNDERQSASVNIFLPHDVKPLESQGYLELWKESKAQGLSQNQNNTVFCPNYAQANYSLPWQEAANILRSGLDERVDPCENFYAFTCNSFMSKVNITNLHLDEFGTSSLAQVRVYAAIANALKDVDVNDTKWFETERITKAAYDACVINKELEFGQDASEDIYKHLQDLNVNVPFLNQTIKDDLDIFAAIGAIERTYGFGALLQSSVNVDYKNISQNVLYVSQPKLPMARDLYVLPHFVGFQNMRTDKIHNTMLAFSMELVDDPSEFEALMHEAADEVVHLEIQIAKASWPKREMSKHTEQYNPHTLESLERIYPNIGWRSYFKKLLDLKNLDGGTLGKDNADFLSVPLNDDHQRIVSAKLHKGRNHRKLRVLKRRMVRSLDLKQSSIHCMEMVVNYLPFGAGYVYVKSVQDREKRNEGIKNHTRLMINSFQDIIKLPNWMSSETKKFALKKAEGIRRNLGWPLQLFGDFKNSSSIDSYHKKDYYAVIDAYNTNNEDFYTMMKILKTALKNREDLRKLKEKPNRKRFEYSPAKVQIKYKPEKNSITIPLASFDSILYNNDYPKTYSIASRGIAIAQELAKAFDEEGIQFDAAGSLSQKWMDLASDLRYMRMKECVILQYSARCCPENYNSVRCSKGENTERQNIADIGGLLAAHKAFNRQIKKRELRLPGLERFTPEQIFWITYGSSLCTLQTDLNLFLELQEGRHSPRKCRVNQALQNLQAFAHDFGCIPGAPMAPTADELCPVWRKE